MSETIFVTEAVEGPVVELAAETVSDDQLIRMLVERARWEGLQLTGAGGLLQQLTKRVQEVDHALEGTPERLPDRVRRPTHPGRPLTTSTTKISR